MKKNFLQIKKDALELDKADKLKKYRAYFNLPKNDVYLNSHSLGLPTKKGIATLARITNEWSAIGVKGWLQGKNRWFTMPEKLSEDMAFVFGAQKNEIIVHASNTVNLYSILTTFFNPKGKRRKILVEQNAFPTDRYAVQAVLKMKGCDPKKDLIEVTQHSLLIDEDAIIERIDESVALVVLPSVQYLSGQLLDIKRITEVAHKKGALVCFICAHSAGLIPHNFHKDNVDFAIFCGYKFLCAGPGSVGGLFIHQKHHNTKTAMPGWWGSKKERQFDMLHDFLPENGPRGFQMATSHILSTAPLLGTVEVLKKCGMKALNEKRKNQMNFLLNSAKTLENLDPALTIVTPLKNFGGHLALEHPHSAAIVKELYAKGIVVDYREPNLMRIAPHPLYTTYKELYEFINQMNIILKSKSYLRQKNKRGLVA